MVTICPGCGNAFRQFPCQIAEGRQHCSMKCRVLAKKRKNEKSCEKCGKTFVDLNAKGRRYCSPACFNEARKKGKALIDVACAQCGNITRVHPCHIRRVNRIFCSMSCRAVAFRKKIDVKCDHCGGTYQALPNAIEKFGRRYCSHKCSAEAKKRGEEKECPVCHANFWSQKHRESMKRGTFCSIRCYRVGSMTRPEREVDAWLESHQVAHENQKRFRIGFVDFFIPHLNLVIEVDGDYWHSFPEQIARDQARTAYLEKIGVNVVRVRETDIYADIDSAMESAGL